VLHAARWKYRTQKWRKNRYLGTIAQLCRGISSQLRHVSTIGKKLVKQQYLLYMTLQYGELQPTSGWDRFVSLGRPSKFQGVSRLGFVTAATSLNGSQPSFARCLAVSCAATLYIHFWRLLPRNGILPGVKSSLRPPSLALSYWQRYCTSLEKWARAKLCGIEHRAPPIFGRATITLGLNPHSSWRWLFLFSFGVNVNEQRIIAF